MCATGKLKSYICSDPVAVRPVDSRVPSLVMHCVCVSECHLLYMFQLTLHSKRNGDLVVKSFWCKFETSGHSGVRCSLNAHGSRLY